MVRSMLKSSDSTLMTLFSHSKQHLLKLNIHSDACELDPLVTCISKFCPLIADLDMRNYKLNRLFFQVLSGLHQLTNLRFTHCTDILAEYCDDLICPSVNNLCLDGKYSAPVQRALLTMCPNITTCRMYYGDGLDLSTLSNQAEKINIFHCVRIIAWKLNSKMSSVRVFRSHLTNEQAAEIIQYCPNLQYMDLGFNNSLLEANILSFCDVYKDRLLGLEVPACGNLTQTGIENALSLCPNLRRLDISRLSPAITQDRLFVAIAKNCPTLYYLAIIRSTISDDALMIISKLSIGYLNMKSSLGYTERGLMALVTGCVQLKKVVVNNVLVTSSPLVKLLWKQIHPTLEFLL